MQAGALVTPASCYDVVPGLPAKRLRVLRNSALVQPDFLPRNPHGSRLTWVTGR